MTPHAAGKNLRISIDTLGILLKLQVVVHTYFPCTRPLLDVSQNGRSWQTNLVHGSLIPWISTTSKFQLRSTTNGNLCQASLNLPAVILEQLRAVATRMAAKEPLLSSREISQRSCSS